MKSTDEILAELQPKPRVNYGPVIIALLLSLPFWLRMIWEFTR